MKLVKFNTWYSILEALLNTKCAAALSLDKYTIKKVYIMIQNSIQRISEHIFEFKIKLLFPINVGPQILSFRYIKFFVFFLFFRDNFQTDLNVGIRLGVRWFFRMLNLNILLIFMLLTVSVICILTYRISVFIPLSILSKKYILGRNVLNQPFPRY